jgi:hypothetical protein
MANNFGVKYIGKEHVHHLIHTLNKDYTILADWDGILYCGITLKWNYSNDMTHQYVDISIPGYIKK